MVNSEIETVFDSFFKKYRFVETKGHYNDNICYKSESVFIEFSFDKRYNEMTIMLFENFDGKRTNVLKLIRGIMPVKFIDVFSYLKYEYENTEGDLSNLKGTLDGEYEVLLLAVCSILNKHFDLIIQELRREIL